MADRISTVNLARRSGVTYRQLDHWTRAGVILPTVPAAGSGSRREYDDDEIRVAEFVARLSRFLCGTVVRHPPATALLRAAAAAIRADPNAWWVRLGDDGVTPVAHPVSDGALYLSVRPAAAMLAPRVEAV